MSQLELERAEDLLRQGRYPEAIDRFRELLGMEPERADLRGRVAEAYRLAGNRDRAFHHFHKAASLFSRQNDLLGAARMLEAANQVSPNEPDVLYRLAEVLKKLGKQRPLQVVLQNLVRAAAGAGDRRRLWALDELIQLQPNDMDVQVERAKVLTEVGRVREAVLLWQQVTDHLAARKEDFVPWLERAAQMAPDRVEVGVALAKILLRHKRAREALALVVPFYEKFPDDVALLETLLGALVALGAKDKILPAQLELLKARTRAGQRTEGLEEVRRLLEERPNDPRVLEVGAHACAAFGLTGEACRLLFDLAGIYDRHDMGRQRDRTVLRILEMRPDHEGALELGARVLRAAGRQEEATALESRLAEVRARSMDELPVLPESPSSIEGRAITKPPGEAVVAITESGDNTVVLVDEDVLVVEEAAAPEPVDFDGPEIEVEVRDLDDGRDPTRTDAVDIGDNTATGEMPAVITDDMGPGGPTGEVEVADIIHETGELTPVPKPSAFTDTTREVAMNDLRREIAETDDYPPLRQPSAPIHDPFFSDTAEERAENVDEVTYRMDELVSAELDALRAELDEDEATAIELEAQNETSPAPRVRATSRPNARLVSDLLQEMEKGKKR